MYKFQHILDDSDARYNAVWVNPKTIMEQELARAFCVIDEKICDALCDHDLKKAEKLAAIFKPYYKKTYKDWLEDIDTYRTPA